MSLKRSSPPDFLPFDATPPHYLPLYPLIEPTKNTLGNAPRIRKKGAKRGDMGSKKMEKTLDLPPHNLTPLISNKKHREKHYSSEIF